MNLTSKGQVTIPKRVRDHLGIGPGSAVRFEVDERGEVLLRREVAEPRSPDRFDRLVGRGQGDLSTDEIMRLMRGD